MKGQGWDLTRMDTFSPPCPPHPYPAHPACTVSRVLPLPSFGFHFAPASIPFLMSLPLPLGSLRPLSFALGRFIQ